MSVLDIIPVLMNRPTVICFILLAILCHSISMTVGVVAQSNSDSKILKQLHVITRHGSRTMLSKDADSLLEQGGETLTPLGQQQLYDLGSWLRQTYFHETTLTATASQNHLLLEYYNPSLHRLESSNLDRTLSSANSLAEGLFPVNIRATGIISDSDDVKYVESLLPQGPPAIPVYTMQDENDIYLRTYKQCPTFNNRLQELYETEEWTALERLNENLLKKLGSTFPEYAHNGRIPLKDVWNVYDPIHVAVTECDDDDSSNITTSSSCDALVPLPSLATAISQNDFARLELLVEKTEHLKYGQETAENLLGSNLLWKIIERSSDPSGGTFFLYSAHAPTLLGFLATLQASNDFVSASNGEHFVDYGSALIVEVYQDSTPSSSSSSSYGTQPLYIKLLYKSPTEHDAVGIPLKQDTGGGVPCGTPNQSDEYCTLSRFTLWAVHNTLIGPENWCLACGNEYADVCLRSKYLLNNDNLNSTSSNTAASTTTATGQNDPEVWKIVVTFLGGFLGGIIGMVLFMCLGRRNHQTKTDIDNITSKNSGESVEIPVAEREFTAPPAEAFKENGNGSPQNDGGAIMKGRDSTVDDEESRVMA